MNNLTSNLKRPSYLIFIGCFLVAAISLIPIKKANAEGIPYVLSGAIKVQATENAVGQMVVGLSAKITAHEDGSVTGKGFITYLQMEACSWAPPHPEGSPSPWCRIDNVEDGSFKILGEVLETVHRHDDDNPLKDSIFALADKNTKHRPGYAPSRISLNLQAGKLPKELLTFWGFSTAKTEYRSTGAAALGLLSSSGFNKTFELTPIAPGTNVKGLKGQNVHLFSGKYKGGTPVNAEGRIALIDADISTLKQGTNPVVYLSHWNEAIAERPLTPLEVEAIEDRNSMLEQMAAAEIAETVKEINDLASVYSKLDMPLPEGGRYSPVKLQDITK